jgi:hypothetical protein
MQPELQTLEERLARAERQVRGLRLAFGAMALAAGALLAVRSGETQNPGTVVKAPLKVVDARGQPVVEIAADQFEGRRLRLLGPKGELLAHLGESGAGGGEFSVYGAGSTAGTLAAESDAASLSLRGKAGKGPTVLLKTTGQGGSLLLNDVNARALFQKP